MIAESIEECRPRFDANVTLLAVQIECDVDGPADRIHSRVGYRRDGLRVRSQQMIGQGRARAGDTHTLQKFSPAGLVSGAFFLSLVIFSHSSSPLRLQPC